VEGNHEAIISPEVFDMVQAELANGPSGGARYSGVSIFSNKIKCADCGGWYGSKVWHSTDRYRKVIYRCNRKYKEKKVPNFPRHRGRGQSGVRVGIQPAGDREKGDHRKCGNHPQDALLTDTLQEEKRKLEDEMAVIVEMTQNIVAENARVAQDQDEYQKRYDRLVQRYEAAKARYDEVVSAISAKEAQDERLSDFIKTLKSQDGTFSNLTAVFGAAWSSTSRSAGTRKSRSPFRDGTEIQA
jgi:site-specific DNA recombinase